MTAFLGGNPLSYEGVKPTNPPQVIVANRDVLISDIGYDIGTIWIHPTDDQAWVLTQLVGGVAHWSPIANGVIGPVETITGDTGGPEAPTIGTGNFNLKGTANQITVTGTANTETWTIPTAFIAPGSIQATTTLTATGGLTTLAALTQTGTTLINASGAAATNLGTGTGATTIGNATGALTLVGNGAGVAVTGFLTASTGLVASTGGVTANTNNITATNGNFVLGTAGNKIISTSVASTTAAGANSFGTVTLVGGTATVSTTAVTASSIILLTRQSVGATGAAALGHLSIGTVTASTSFVINAWSSTDATALAATDVSSIGWMIIN